MQRLVILTLFLSLASCNGGGESPIPTGGNSANPNSGPTGDESDKGNVTLTAADDVTVYGTLTTAKDDNDRVILLFHQADSNRHEYDPIAPRLNELGYDTLAIDQRSGGTMWKHDNETVNEIGNSQQYLYALPDLQAAVDWAVQKKYTTIIAVGSSYSAALSFILAKANPKKLAAIASFSPGEYLGSPHLVKDAAAEVKIPIYVTAAADDGEQSQLDDVLSKSSSDKITRHKPAMGVHGASTLREDKNSDGAEANFAEFEAFLKTVAD